ncbi:Ubiquitin carboxyl-terminal hydrolase 19 [Geodia barretti]|uniref:ubiquitinyl hydrolase 1 n=2 Tax=Geodia barretti TaxID=519541 RepID=A0AA35TBB6_GEOBA|nr:Ubiquitin carboxyl-terminal hydrolase 19 [Geodia barretti]
MACPRRSDAEWYQNDTHVTASVLIKRLPTREGLRPVFEQGKCAIYIGDEVFWEVALAGSIIPDKCTFKTSKFRAELKMTKKDPVLWADYEAIVAPSSSSPQQARGPVTSNEALSPPPPPPPASSPGSKRKHPNPKTFSKAVQNDFVYLNHLSHTWQNKGSGGMAIRVHVGDVMKETCTVDFKERQFELLFQTRNEAFLSSYTGSCQTTFVWKVHLHDSIQPSVSHFEVTPRAIDIVLKKAFDKKWTMLEKSKHHPSLTNSSSDSSSVVEGDQASSNQNEPSLNALETEMNNLSIAGDVIATPPSQPQTIRNVGGNSPDPIQNHHSSDHGNRAPSTSSDTAAVYHHGNEVGEPVQKIYMNPLYKEPSSKTTKQKPHSHYTHTVAASELEMSDPSFREKQLGQPSKTGLINLGNTCFMNSVIQCLSNTPELRDYFVKGHYLANINSQNPLGFEGKLAKCFCVILRKLWSGEYGSFSPRKLLEIVAKRSKYFGGNSQHDTHEFMSYLIDGLHEDLNRVREKPVTKPVEMEDYPDREVAAESWRLHKKRNDSMIVDLFQGQFKSTLVCQECNKESVTFDPFMSLSVPIPRNLRRLPVIFVPQDPNSLPKQLILQLPPEATLKLLKASVGRRTSLSMAQLRVFEVYKGKFQSLMSDNNHPISGIKSSDTIIVSEVLSERAAKGPVVEINVVQRVHVTPFPTKCALCGCGVEKGRKLQRCSKCKTVGYCHRTCQERDWPEHKRKCGKVKAFPTGLPFVISLPANQLTYSRLMEYAETFSRRSICVRRREIQLNHEKQDRIQESAESMQTSEGSIQESTESVQSSQEDMEMCTGEYPRVHGEYPRVHGEYPRVHGEYPRVHGEYPRVYRGYPRKTDVHTDQSKQVFGTCFWSGSSSRQR